MRLPLSFSRWLMVLSLVVAAASGARAETPSPEPETRLDSRLRQRMAARRQSDVENQPRTPETRVRLWLSDPAAIKSLERLGARDIFIFRDAVWATVPVTALSEAAAVPGISFIAPAERLHANTEQSEGVSLTGAADFHLQGVRGQGVRIAIVDSSFSQLLASIALGEFGSPAHRIVNECTYNYATNVAGIVGVESFGELGHGTMVAQIVHDMAPDAELCLKLVESEDDVIQAALDARQEGTQILSMSQSWFNRSYYDGTGDVSAIVAQTSDRMLWVVSAGNYAEQHWRGTFLDTDGDGLHELGPIRESHQAVPGLESSTLYVMATWDDWPASAVDYDVYLLRGEDCVDDHSDLAQVQAAAVAVGDNRQDGTLPPVEEIEYPLPPGDRDYCVVLARIAGPPGRNPEITVFTPRTFLTHPVAESSLAEPAASDDAVAVGAISIEAWDLGSPTDYSSRGPRNLSLQVAVPVRKPDIAAPTGVTVAAESGPQPFSGTSASAPHVAGCAALILSEAAGNLTVGQLRNRLQIWASDVNPPGKDNATGFGSLRCSPGASPCGDDSLEEDDFCGSARAVAVGTTERHGHCDEDWVRFPVEYGRTYSVTAAGIAGTAPVLELYRGGTCSEALASAGDSLSWTATSSGEVRLRVRDLDHAYGDGRIYDLSVRADLPSECGASSIEPTVRSTTQGGNWNNPAAWSGGRLPVATDRVAIDGTVYLNVDAEVSGLLISPGAVLYEGTYSPTLTVHGDMVNRGSIRNANWTRLLRIDVRGNVTNEGSIEASRALNLKVQGCLANEGSWGTPRTALTGSGPRSIRSTTPLGGEFTVAADLEALGSFALAETLLFDRGSLTIPAPYVVTVGGLQDGVVHGTGTLVLKGGQMGSLTGDLAELRLGASTLLLGSIHLPNVVVEGNPARFRNATLGGGLTIEAGAVLQDDASSSVLTVGGNLINDGTFRTSSSLNGYAQAVVFGDVTNRGTVSTSFFTAHGDIENEGTWNSARTQLAGSKSPRVLGPKPLGGTEITLLESFEVAGNVAVSGVLATWGKILTIPAPYRVTVGGIRDSVLDGTGILVLAGTQIGPVSGGLAELRLTGSATLSGSVQLPRVVVEGASVRFRNATLAGGLTVEPGAVLEDDRGSYRLTVNGDLLNQGTIRRAQGVPAVKVGGDLNQDGLWQGMKAFLIWPAATGAQSYDLQLSASLETWPIPLSMTVTEHEVTSLVNSTRFWRVRTVAAGEAGPWSEVLAINRTVLTVTSPSETETYAPGDSVALAWESQHAGLQDQVVLSMKRDSAASALTEPDGVNWVRFTNGTPNDGSEAVSLPDGIASAEDWRFYVQHAATGAYDATDFSFTVSAPPPVACSDGSGLCFYTVTPCRLLDTRLPDQGPAAPSGVSRIVAVAGHCEVPASAKAVVVNITAVAPVGNGRLTVYPADVTPPATSTLSFTAGKTRANSAFLGLSADGSGQLVLLPFIGTGGEVHVLLDVTGYFE